MFGRFLRFLFALPVALAVTAGLYYFWFARFFDRDADFPKAAILVADQPRNLQTRTDQGWGPPLCVDCSGPPLEQPKTLFLYDPPCQLDCGEWFVSEATDQARELAVPDDAFSVKTNPDYKSREAIYSSPRYPKACIKKRASGAVVVEFDITPEGAVTNARIIQSPDRCFNSEVLRFASKFRYRPQADASGRSAWRRGVRETFSFELSE